MCVQVCDSVEMCENVINACVTGVKYVLSLAQLRCTDECVKVRQCGNVVINTGLISKHSYTALMIVWVLQCGNAVLHTGLIGGVCVCL